MPSDQRLLKIGDLARLTGVSTATVRFYIREGLLPRPTVKTSRNMAWYDEGFVQRIRLIRRLQQQQRLPLKMIRSLVSSSGAGDAEVFPSLVELEARILPRIHLAPPGPALSRAAAIERSGIEPGELDDLVRLGVISVEQSASGPAYSTEDAALIDLVGRLRALGVARDLFPTSDVLLYHDWLADLVGQEVQLYARRLKGRELPQSPQVLLEAAISLIGEFIVRLRRKLIVDLVAGLDLGEQQAAPPVAGRGRRRRP